MKNIVVSPERAKGIRVAGVFTFLTMPFVLCTKIEFTCPLDTIHERLFCYSRTKGHRHLLYPNGLSVLKFCVYCLILFATGGNIEKHAE